MASLLGIGSVGSAGSVDDLIQAASTPPPTGAGATFRRVMGGVVGAAANVFMPGLGSVLSNVIGGSGTSGFSFGSSTTPAQMLQMQMQMEQEQEAFTCASTIMKDRHDAAMDAIRNAKSN